MTKEANGTGPELIVLGQDDQGKPRAARFPASQADFVAKAAKAMNLTVCKADGAALAELAKKLAKRPVVRDRPGLCAPGRAQPVRQDRRAIEARRSAGTRRNRSVETPISPRRGCRQPGTTSPSATW